MLPILALLLLSTAPLLAQDHSHHGDHGGLPPLKPIAEGSMHTAADVQFMQGMIAHHAQAIRMSALAATRSGDARLIRFAQKIDQSQTAEIQLMGDWLAERNQVVPDSAMWVQITMPGMLTAAELTELATLKGAAFDRRFLELMIRHHEGAIAMVADLFATPRAGQQVDVNVFANEVEQVQSVEIALMRQMLVTLEGAR
jgi:uncharacterized protein (DUF305 family)